MSLLNDALRKKEKEVRDPRLPLSFCGAPPRRRPTLKIAILVVLTLALGALYLIDALLFDRPQSKQPRLPAPQAASPAAPATEVTTAAAVSTTAMAPPLQAPPPAPTRSRQIKAHALDTTPRVAEIAPAPAPAVAAAATVPATDATAPTVTSAPAAAPLAPLPPAEPPLSAQLPPELQPFFAKAQALQSEGRSDEAIILYRQLLNQAPRHRSSLFALTEALIAVERYEEALPLATRLSRDLPDDPRAWLDLALVEIGRGESDRALPHLDRVEAAGSYPFEVQLNRGSAHGRAGRIEPALSSYRAAERLRPTDPTLLFNLALTLDKAGRSGEAQSAYERYLKGDDSRHPHRRPQVEQRLATLRRHQAQVARAANREP